MEQQQLERDLQALAIDSRDETFIRERLQQKLNQSVRRVLRRGVRRQQQNVKVLDLNVPVTVEERTSREKILRRAQECSTQIVNYLLRRQKPSVETVLSRMKGSTVIDRGDVSFS